MIWGRATFLVVLGPLAFVNANESRTRAQQTTIPISDGIAADPHGPNICEARTINYITHTLPQSCLTTSWASPHPLSSTYAGPVGSDGVRESITTFTSDPTVSEAHTAEATATTFMSFEDWKEMMLRRAGQDPQEWRSRKPSDHTPDDRYLPDMGDAGLGEEDEISLDFDSYRYQSGDDKKGDMTGSAEANDDRNSHDAQAYGDGKAATIHRSKDAGKTCKERFSYSSFDAGATILKTAAGAKNARAILVENKDSYMLLECAAPTKYVIFELSDDILVDTIVIANFEFFSSMIRLFRVSVSDRYPVKTERWRELGTFEARNSRDIQPFLVDNPQIWAKYRNWP
ncbi:hypothetical protein RJ55_03497 [Drechmeria coniospora]|nr:hypothetical protein RJ55_03497 [Drechmeria coniospora]